MKRKDVRTEQDRDRGIERWLGRRAELPPPSGACLDPDTIAAWADGTLTRDERQRAESHAADCARCQAILAAMMRTEPPVSQHASWRSRWPWLVPIAAGATAVALWVSVGTDVLHSPAPSDMLEQTAASQPQEPPSPPPPPLPPPPAQERADAAPQQKPAASSPPPRLEAARRPQAESDKAAETAAAAPAERRKAEQKAFGAIQGFADMAWTEVPSPDPNVRVRFTAMGRVERSTDAGATWTPQTIAPAVRLAGGSAPSADVCWLVGSAGTVLRSVDGATWTRVPFPEAADLVSVSATDASIATVVTRDGRRFETHDGGQTWSAPRLQENPDPAF